MSYNYIFNSLYFTNIIHPLCFCYLTYMICLHSLTPLLCFRMFYWYYACNIYFHDYEILLKPLLMNKITPLDNWWRISKIWWAQRLFTIALSKKNTINAMFKSNIPMHAMVFHCGWEKNIPHTILSYIFTYMSNYMWCEKALANWFYKVFSDIHGSFTQTLDDIWTEYEKVQLFVNSRFIHNTGIQHSTKLKRILAASVLIFHDAFLGIIVNEPSVKYKDTIHQTFHQTIISVPFESNIPNQTF